MLARTRRLLVDGARRHAARSCSSGASSNAPPPPPPARPGESLPPPSLTGSIKGPQMLPATGKYPKNMRREDHRKINPYELQQLNSFLGFSSRRTHPSNYNYLLGHAGGQAIISPEDTLVAMRRTLHLLKKVTFRGGRTLFVSTQPTLARLCRVIGEQSGQYYLARRWVPGLLTNWGKSREHIHSKLNPDPVMKAAGKLKYSDLQKMAFFRGVEDMSRPPDLIFRLDSTELYGEPAKLNIPLISVVDSDMPSFEIDYPIPANTKSLRFYHTLANMLIHACNEGAALRGELEHYGVKAEPEPEKEGGRGGRGGRGSGPRRNTGDGPRPRGGRGGRFRAPDSRGKVPAAGAMSSER